MSSERAAADLAQLRVAARSRRHRRVHARQPRAYIAEMNLELPDEEAVALVSELAAIIESDKYQFSPRIRTLKAILRKLRPEPVRGKSSYSFRRATAQAGRRASVVGADAGITRFAAIFL